MFYYYGRKKRLAKYYPLPKHNTIIEPFAGSAAYSLYGDNWKKDVILIEKDPDIYNIWLWLINEATPVDIATLPSPKVGDYVTDKLMILHGVSSYNGSKSRKVTPLMLNNWTCSKHQMANNVHKIKHWKIVCGDYTCAPDTEATWFIDPPYFGSPGSGYKYGSRSIDYQKLASWILARQGQVISCESPKASYLPFKRLCSLSSIAGRSSTEYVYYNCPD